MKRAALSARETTLEIWLILFYIFSVAGWTWEVLFTAATTGQWVNRGLLHGPWLPLYGTGGIILSLLLARSGRRSGESLFIGALTGGLAEYCTAWVLEAVYGQRWWSYEGYPGSIHGRVCLASIMAFAAAGWVVFHIAPVLLKKIAAMRQSKRSAVCRSISLMFAADWSLSLIWPNIGTGISFPL